MQGRRFRWFPWEPKRFALASLAIVAMTAGATATAGLLEVRSLTRHLHRVRPLPQISATEAGAPQTVLLLGSDRRFASSREPAFSDTIMLVRLDPGRGATAVMSVPRDLAATIEVAPGQARVAKITEAFALGGPALTVKTVRELLGIPINHVLSVTFDGFRDAVDTVGCVYVDVDRRYFNSNAGPGRKYDAIDLQPGYQRLCGENALDYVRYRHDDSDLVRTARQQEFLRQVKQQLGVRRLLSNRSALARVMGRSTQTDLHTTKEVLRLLKLVIFAAGHPIRDIRFPASPGGGDDPYVHASPAAIRRAVRRFLAVKSPSGPRGRLRPTPSERGAAGSGRSLGAGLEDAAADGRREAAPLLGATRIPIYYPGVRPRRAVFAEPPRAYSIADEDGNEHDAFRIVVKLGLSREYYGVQGTAWKDPPILEDPSRRRRVGGRTFELFFAGGRLQLVAWRTREAVYWVSNTLLGTLSTQQMLAIASSLKRY